MKAHQVLNERAEVSYLDLKCAYFVRDGRGFGTAHPCKDAVKRKGEIRAGATRGAARKLRLDKRVEGNTEPV